MKSLSQSKDEDSDEKKNKYLLLSSFVVLLIIFGISTWRGISAGIAMGQTDQYYLEHWREFTVPLEDETIIDLCSKFNLSPDDPLCDLQSDVYGPDFFQLVKETFTPSNSDWATYEEVEVYLSEYRYFCTELIVTGDGHEYYRCEYDLAGDRSFPIFLYYNIENRIYRIIANVSR